ALEAMTRATPAKYDPLVVKAWLGLLQAAQDEGTLTESLATGCTVNREFPRFPIECPARAQLLEPGSNASHGRPAMQVVAHNISRSGLGLLTKVPLQPNEHLRVCLEGSGSLSRVEEGV